jgi:sterol desaturase/sphingolipid hydroxylase (fatty acid hydroxylase superfamily)
LDTFYMFFNFFILNLIVLIALSNTVAEFLNDALSTIGLSLSSFQLFDSTDLPKWLGLFIFFLVNDFVQWNTHRLLHRVPWLWNFHKVHHSVKQMGFAAHLRYHWMEPVVYNSIRYIPLALIANYSSQDVAIVYFFSIAIGHLNHANLGWDYGLLKYIFNNPKMHIWHHAKELPKDVSYGVNWVLKVMKRFLKIL